MSYKGKVVIVTGAASGIGRETAKAFLEQGSQVVIADNDETKGKKAAAELNCNSLYIHLDVADAESVKKMVAEVKKKFGRIDILVNNAGIFSRGNVITTSEEDWDKLLSINLKSMYLCSKFVIPVMLDNGSGVIVNVSSEAGLVGFPDQTAYNVSKAGVISLTKSLAVDFSPRGIRVNVVCPGTTRTALFENNRCKSDDPEQFLREKEALRPLKRLGNPEEIAAAIMMLSSDELAYATGSIFCIDGGYTAQ